MFTGNEATATMDTAHGELLTRVLEMSGLGGVLMTSVVVIAVPSIALIEQPSHVQSLLWFATLMTIFFSGLYLFSQPRQAETLSENAPADYQRLACCLKRSVLFAVMSTLLFPPVCGTVALVYAVKARRMTSVFGNFFIIMAAVAMLLGGAFAGLLSLSI
jgi:hypothetical protein